MVSDVIRVEYSVAGRATPTMHYFEILLDYFLEFRFEFALWQCLQHDLLFISLHLDASGLNHS